MQPHAGSPETLLAVNERVGTVFVVATLIALTGRIDVLYTALSVLLFFVGGGIFLLGFWNAVQRSKAEIVNLPVLLGFDSGAIAPTKRWRLWAPLLITTVVSIAGATFRPFTQQAFGILAPLFGLGVIALWTSRFARFERRM